jgi:hypothetical protein
VSGPDFLRSRRISRSYEPDDFWTEMDRNLCVHPLDENGVRQNYSAIPQRLQDLVDDVYRSLAGYARNAGGFDKTPTAFAEFIWADYLPALRSRGTRPLRLCCRRPGGHTARPVVNLRWAYQASRGNLDFPMRICSSGIAPSSLSGAPNAYCRTAPQQ